MLTAENLVRAAGARRLVDQVSCQLAPGALHVIVGPNGAGKSTLLRLLTGELAPAAGTVSYDGVDLRRCSREGLARMRATLSQNVEIAFPLRVREVVMMGRYPHFTGRPAAEDLRACDEVMDLFDVSAMAGRDFLTLSGGEQQRVHFARVLAQIWTPRAGSRYLFLDEPLTFLDIRYQLDFMKTLRTLRAMKDLVIVGVLHDLNLAARHADSLLLLHGGKVLASGRPEAVLTPANLEAAFHVRPSIVQSANGPLLVFE